MRHFAVRRLVAAVDRRLALTEGFRFWVGQALTVARGDSETNSRDQFRLATLLTARALITIVAIETCRIIPISPL